MAVAVALSGCMAMLPRASVHPRAKLRDRNGACTYFDKGNVCAFTGSPGTLSDDGKTPLLKVYVQDWGWQLSNPGNWQITVTAPDGRVLLKKIMEKAVPNVGTCISSGCLKWAIDVLEMPEPWSPGVYAFDFVCVFDTSIVDHSTITLQ